MTEKSRCAHKQQRGGAGIVNIPSCSQSGDQYEEQKKRFGPNHRVMIKSAGEIHITADTAIAAVLSVASYTSKPAR